MPSGKNDADLQAVYTMRINRLSPPVGRSGYGGPISAERRDGSIINKSLASFARFGSID
ncbi:hypothetical protein SAMN03080610_01115 [Afifella marina DSM 2698]|uniref:Uncharacterized protein n=1 Tax=Afifella marina DSM 2698 TaxID=1120955 RepID=A0A1G5MW41_AFIMA|nr:hypothetical protein SAMN03080610_01115 [Afifella marina DSM 2698]